MQDLLIASCGVVEAGGVDEVEGRPVLDDRVSCCFGCACVGLGLVELLDSPGVEC